MSGCSNVINICLPILIWYAILNTEIVPFLYIYYICVILCIKIEKLDHFQINIVNLRFFIHRCDTEKPLVVKLIIFLLAYAWFKFVRKFICIRNRKLSLNYFIWNFKRSTLVRAKYTAILSAFYQSLKRDSYQKIKKGRLKTSFQCHCW